MKTSTKLLYAASALAIAILAVFIYQDGHNSNLAGGRVVISTQIICRWNGANYTTIKFASNSVTPVYATSTSCN